MPVSAQVKSLLDQSKANKNVAQSADLGIKAIAVQIAELGTQIAGLQLQHVNGGVLHPDDLTALATKQRELAETAASLQTEILDNTAVPPAKPTTGLVPTTVAIKSSANPSVAGVPVTLTAGVTQTNPDKGAAPVVPTGSVKFMSDGAEIGNGKLDPTGATTISVPFAMVSGLSIGHSVTAVYSGDSVNTGATSTPLMQLVSAAGL